MAVAATESSNNLKALLDGMKMIQTEFDRAFSDLGIERIDAVGKEFDPNTQEAVSPGGFGQSAGGQGDPPVVLWL